MTEHTLGGAKLGTNSYLSSIDDAQKVLDAVNNGKVKILSSNPGQNRIYVEFNDVVGYYNNNGIITTTNRFLIKGGSSANSTIVPIHSNSATFK